MFVRLQRRCVSFATRNAPRPLISLTFAQRSFFSVTAPWRQSWASRSSRRWMCVKEECRHVNSSRESNCEKCATVKPILAGWKCMSCGTKNHRGVKNCKKCTLPDPKTHWCCAVCEGDNKIDHFDDSSRCGHCGYDMAPMSHEEEELLRAREEKLAAIRSEQERFDQVTTKEAEEQLGDEVADLPAAQPAWVKPALAITPIAPFNPSANNTARQTAVSIVGRRRVDGTTVAKAAVRRKTPLRPKVPEGPPGFDWFCREPTCGTVNGAADANCTACQAQISPDEWECQACAATNHWTRAACFSCNIRIPVSWECGNCRASTSIYDKNCRSCSAQRPQATPQLPKDVKIAVKSGQIGRSHQPKKADWSCPSCHMLNFGSRSRCYKCEAERPSLRSGSGGSADAWETGIVADQAAQSVGESNWSCPSCHASNFRTRTACWQCGTQASASATGWEKDSTTTPTFEHEGFQAGAPDIAPGQVKQWGSKAADEWTCNKCYSKNFKNRQECHKCGSAKSALVVPRRVQAKKPVKI